MGCSKWGRQEEVGECSRRGELQELPLEPGKGKMNLACHLAMGQEKDLLDEGGTLMPSHNPVL